MDWFYTPNSLPETKRQFLLEIPDNPDIIAAILGHMNELAYSQAWAEGGTVTPAEMAEAIRDMIGTMLEGEIILTTPGLMSRVTLWQPHLVRNVGNLFIANVTSGQMGGFWFQNPPASGDTWTHEKLTLQPGTWQVRLHCLKGASSGRLHLSLRSGADILTFWTALELYNAGTLTNQIEVANLDVPYERTWDLVGTTVEKHASSSGFLIAITSITLIRLGD